MGTLISYPFISKINRQALGALLAVSAGALIYFGASHLLPEVEKENRRSSIISLGVGIFIAVFIVISKGYKRYENRFRPDTIKASGAVFRDRPYSFENLQLELRLLPVGPLTPDDE